MHTPPPRAQAPMVAAPTRTITPRACMRRRNQRWFTKNAMAHQECDNSNGSPSTGLLFAHVSALWPLPLPRPPRPRCQTHCTAPTLRHHQSHLAIGAPAAPREGARGRSHKTWSQTIRPSRDHSGRGSARALLQLGDLQRDLGDGLDDVERVQAEVAIRCSVLFEVHADCRAVDARAREAEDESGSILEDEADALIFGEAAVDRILVLEHVGLLYGHAVDASANHILLLLHHSVHHVRRRRLVDALVVIPGIVVTTILRPVRLANVLDAKERLGGVRVLRRQDLKPRHHCPHAILLTNVVAACAERLLSANEGCVRGCGGEDVGARVHQIAKELPSSRHLEERNAKLLRYKVHGHRGRHRACASLESVLEPRDARGVGDDDGERVRGRAEELAAHDHVAVSVAVGGGAEGRRRLLRVDLQPLLVETHRRNKLNSVSEVGVGVTVRCRVFATKVLLRVRVDERGGRCAELLKEDGLGVGALHAMHRVVEHREILAREEALDGGEVEDLLEQFDVILDAREDLDGERLVGRAEIVRRCLAEVQVWQVRADVVRLELLGELADEVSLLLGRRAAILTVVLDAEVLIDATRVVRR
mmetsp:Transcript_2942/g.6275  ORF Transcript_2942/g.6275 Transcript_2942/m.6275 type:complete len:591 (-) Transcript_2942:578-2350(-)